MVKKINAIVSLVALGIFVCLLFLQEKSIITIVRRRHPVVYSKPKELVSNWRCIEQLACIYSAYWDERFTPPFVRLIAMVSKNANVSSWMCLLTHNDAPPIQEPLKILKIPESHGKNHLAVFLLCYAKKRPKEIDIIAGSFNISSIRVQTIKLDENAKSRLAICVRPIFGKFSNNNLIIAEFLAYYQELGADHFTFYDYESDPSLKQLLYELIKNGFPLDLLPWNLPKEFSDAWAYGQMAFAADCLYRNSHNYEFVATVDVDEFIIPKEDVSLKVIIERLSVKDPKWGTYMFRQTFFCLEYEDDLNSVNLTIPLITQTKTRHEKKLWPYYVRSKCIVRPIAVVTPGIHYSWIQLQSWKTLRISSDIALLHHYRAKKCKINKGDVGVIETTALRYGKRILDSPVFQVWKKLNL